MSESAKLIHLGSMVVGQITTIVHWFPLFRFGSTILYAGVYSNAPGTDLFARVPIVFIHISKKAFRIFTQNYLPSLFIRIILALPRIPHVSL